MELRGCEFRWVPVSCGEFRIRRKWNINWFLYVFCTWSRPKPDQTRSWPQSHPKRFQSDLKVTQSDPRRTQRLPKVAPSDPNRAPSWLHYIRKSLKFIGKMSVFWKWDQMHPKQSSDLVMAPFWSSSDPRWPQKNPQGTHQVIGVIGR